MSKETRTIQVHPNNPVQAELNHTHIYEGVRVVDMEYGLHLWGKDDQLIASYQDHAWASWNVLPTKPKSTGGHLGISVGPLKQVSEEELAEEIGKRKRRERALVFADRRDTEPAGQIKANNLPPRDHLGRFTKRK